MATYNLPPIIDYSLPAFKADEDLIIPFEYPMDFNKNNIRTNARKVKMECKIIHNDSYTVINYTSNFLLINDTTKEWMSELTIPFSTFTNTGIYKIQLRFIVSNSDYSEWSSICYVKCIQNAIAKITNFPNNNSNYVITNDSPSFTGTFSSTDEKESEYKFELFLTTNSAEPIATSGWFKHVDNTVDIYTFPILLTDFTSYELKYTVKTINNYTTFSLRKFVTAFYTLENDIGLAISTTNDYDNGMIKVNITGAQIFAGNLMLRRSSSKTNYTIWEDISYLQVLNEEPNIVYYDYLVEHGVSYRYGVQIINQSKYRSQLIKTSKPTMAQFEDIFLVSNNEQVKIKFNPKIGNLKRNLLEAKQDTIGNQYPYIMKNGNSNYFSFTLGGLISYFADTNNSNLFRTRTQSDQKSMLDIRTTNLNDVNIYNERQYREKIEQFLTNGKAKLFKSPTEGNMLVYLMQVSLTPNDTVGRLIYSFTSTAYEIGSSFNAEDLIKHNISNKGEWIAVENMGTAIYPFSTQYIGQFNNNYNDIYAAIKRTIESQIVGTCSPRVEYLTYISIRPDSNLNIIINDNSHISISANNGYVLDDIIKIESLKFNGMDGVNSFYIEVKAVVNFVPNLEEDVSMNIGSNVEAVTQIGQINPSFGISPFDINHTDLGAYIEDLYELKKFFSLTYLRIRSAGAAFKIIINGQNEGIPVISDKSLEITYPITSCIIDLNGNETVSFYADFIYNGYKDKV